MLWCGKCLTIANNKILCSMTSKNLHRILSSLCFFALSFIRQHVIAAAIQSAGIDPRALEADLPSRDILDINRIVGANNGFPNAGPCFYLCSNDMMADWSILVLQDVMVIKM